MSQIREFIKKYVSAYLNLSRHSEKEETLHIPPNGQELEDLIEYLNNKSVDPIIVGSVALVIHLNLKNMEEKEIPPTQKVALLINSASSREPFRSTQDIDLFVSRELPKPPLGWKRDPESKGVISWISPSGGYVDFLIAGHEFPDHNKNPQKIGKDPKSEAMGCSVADVTSLFLLKLNSWREKDLADLITFAGKVGIPSDLRTAKLNKVQEDNLSLVHLWLEQGSAR